MEADTKNILITGATGLLGSCITKDLLIAGYKVKATYRKEERIDQFKKNVSFYENWDPALESNLEWVEADVLDYISLLENMNGIDSVVHCAAMVSFYKPDKPFMYEVNIKGTANVVNACIEKKVKRLLHISSVAALGKTDNGGLIDEDTPWIPQKKHSGYSISKFHSEMEVWRGTNEGLPAIILNPSIILGPGEWKSGSASFIHKINKGLKFYTNGTTGFVDVRDVSQATINCLDKTVWSKQKNQRFVLNAENLSYKEAFKQIADALGVKGPKIHANKRLLALAWRAAWLFSKLSGSKPQITKDSVVNAANKIQFDGSKICKKTGFQYRSIDKTIKEVAGMYLSDH